MKIEQFDPEDRRKESPANHQPSKRYMPKVPPDPNYPTTPFDFDKWNKDAKRVYEEPNDKNKETPPKRYMPKVPPDPNYPTTPFDFDKWNKDAKRVYEGPDMPVPGDTIRTPKLEGKVSKVEEGYVYFTTADGRNMRNTIENCTVIEKLADQECNMCGDMELDEVSTELLTKYKTAASADAREADKAGDYERGNKRFSGIVKATKKQFDNDAKKRTKANENSGQSPGMFEIYNTKTLQTVNHPFEANDISDAFIKADDWLESIGKNGNGLSVRPVRSQNEGTMGGINRSAPAVDVSYEKVLDEVRAMWEETKLDELSVGKLQAYKDAAKSPESFKNRPLRKLAKTIQGVQNAGEKIKVKTGDKRGMKQPDRGTFESLEEADFGDIMRNQDDAPKPGQTVDKEYNGWIIRYQLAPRVKGQPVQWMAWHGKKDPSTAKRGSAPTPDAAFQDATAFINSGGDSQKNFVGNKATISFNVHFTRQIVPAGEPFFAKFEDGFLMVSLRPQQGFSRAAPYRGNLENEKYYNMPISAAEAQSQKLVPNGRYTLGSKDEIDSETWMFDIHFQGVVASTADKLRLREPGFTVASNRDGVEEDCWDGYQQYGIKDKGGEEVPNCVPDTNEAYMGPHHGDPDKLAKAPKSSMQGKEHVRFSELVQDAINTHGVKWAFDYYVNKHGLPPRQFQIFAGLTANKPKADPRPTPAPAQKPATPPVKQSWWKKLRGKLPFEE